MDLVQKNALMKLNKREIMVMEQINALKEPNNLLSKDQQLQKVF